MTQEKYRISRGSSGGYYDYACQQMCGLYDSLEEAREQIPDDWVRDDQTDADLDGEAYYQPGTTDDEMDGYGALVIVVRELIDDDDDLDEESED